jgi:hypothetical protein
MFIRRWTSSYFGKSHLNIDVPEEDFESYFWLTQEGERVHLADDGSRRPFADTED